MGGLLLPGHTSQLHCCAFEDLQSFEFPLDLLLSHCEMFLFLPVCLSSGIQSGQSLVRAHFCPSPKLLCKIFSLYSLSPCPTIAMLLPEDYRKLNNTYSVILTSFPLCPYGVCVLFSLPSCQVFSQDIHYPSHLIFPRAVLVVVHLISISVFFVFF